MTVPFLLSRIVFTCATSHNTQMVQECRLHHIGVRCAVLVGLAEPVIHCMSNKSGFTENTEFVEVSKTLWMYVSMARVTLAQVALCHKVRN